MSPNSEFVPEKENKIITATISALPKKRVKNLPECKISLAQQVNAFLQTGNLENIFKLNLDDEKIISILNDPEMQYMSMPKRSLIWVHIHISSRNAIFTGVTGTMYNEIMKCISYKDPRIKQCRDFYNVTDTIKKLKEPGISDDDKWIAVKSCMNYEVLFRILAFDNTIPIDNILYLSIEKDIEQLPICPLNRMVRNKILYRSHKRYAPFRSSSCPHRIYALKSLTREKLKNIITPFTTQLEMLKPNLSDLSLRDLHELVFVAEKFGVLSIDKIIDHLPKCNCCIKKDNTVFPVNPALHAPEYGTANCIDLINNYLYNKYMARFYKTLLSMTPVEKDVTTRWEEEYIEYITAKLNSKIGMYKHMLKTPFANSEGYSMKINNVHDYNWCAYFYAKQQYWCGERICHKYDNNELEKIHKLKFEAYTNDELLKQGTIEYANVFSIQDTVLEEFQELHEEKPELKPFQFQSNPSPKFIPNGTRIYCTDNAFDPQYKYHICEVNTLVIDLDNELLKTKLECGSTFEISPTGPMTYIITKGTMVKHTYKISRPIKLIRAGGKLYVDIGEDILHQYTI